MKKILFCAALFFLSGFTVGAQQMAVAPYLPGMSSAQNDRAPITLQHPQENVTVAAGAQNIYLFGKLNLEQATLHINGQAVPVFKNGTFIAYIPVKQGPFDIVLTAQSQGQTYQAVRHITVPGTPLEKFADKARFDSEQIYPNQPVWLLPGDTFNLSARGTPGAQVTATLSGIKNAKDISLQENIHTPGLYTGQYVIPNNQKPRKVKITYRMFDPVTRTKVKIKAKQKLQILDPEEPPQPARVNDPGVKLRKIPVHEGNLFPYYRTFGHVLIDGRDKGLYRLRLTGQEHAWLEEEKLDLTRANAYQSNTLSQVHTQAEPTVTRITWKGTQQVPVSVHEFKDRVEVAFYYTDTFEDNFDFDATSPILDRITWQPVQDGMIKFTLFIKPDQTLWGHGYQYDETDFGIQLYHQPEINSTAKKPLAGARILLDAGHSPKRKPPYDGLVSPSGFLEYEANLALAEVLKSKLQAAGATVIMTRQGDNHISLPGRYKKALREKAHLFISLHHNALPDTANPIAQPLGYSVYYMYLHSFKLAESVHKAFNKKIPLTDSGLINNTVLFVPRISEMPSILIENAYMILPEQEAFVMSDEGRELFAQTIYEGILNFYGVKPPPVMSAKKTKSKKK
ncbi:MAG: N-acetylmuramoyl-L-alanine amidase [Elusimicrobiaceae bacterium]|nr:N-acetylmuramoyl-L-alanine amidase [Elusimicrobiaceae bacterium]